MRVKYQAAFFADLSVISATPENTMSLMGALSRHGLGLLPSSIRELTAPNMVPINRPIFVSPDGDIQLTIGMGRIDITKQVPPINGPQLGGFGMFVELVQKCLSAVFQDNVIHGSRLAFITQHFSSELTPENINNSFSKLFFSPSFYAETLPTEWTFRANAKKTINFGNFAEDKANSILKVERMQGQYVDAATGMIEFDRIISEIDINTNPMNQAVRFSPFDLLTYIQAVEPIAREIEESLSELIGGEL